MQTEKFTKNFKTKNRLQAEGGFPPNRKVLPLAWQLFYIKTETS